MDLGGHAAYPIIRGVTGLTVDGPAAVLVDGLAPRGHAVDALLDVDQIEILAGPQGTLYGTNSLPGVVAITTQDPTAQSTGWLRFDGGSFHTAQVASAVSGPLTESLSGRVAVAGARSDGWRTNVMSGANDGSGSRDLQGRLKLLWRTDAGWLVKVAGEAARFRANGDQYAPWSLTDTHETTNNEVGAYDHDLGTAALTLTREWGSRKLTAITGWSRTRDDYRFDADFGPAPLAVADKYGSRERLSQEVRLAGGKGLRGWVLGLAGEAQGDDVAYRTTLEPPLTPVPLSDARRSNLHSSGGAAFAQGGLDLGAGVVAIAGLRIDHQRSHIAYAYDHPLVPFTYDDAREDTLLLPKAGLAWDGWSHGLTWGTISRGSTAGGYNLTATTPVEVVGGYAPETAWCYELGQRCELADQLLRSDTVIFLMDYQDKQVQVLQPPTDLVVRNAAHARITGISQLVVLTPVEPLSLRAGVEILHAEFHDYAPRPGSDFSGNQMPWAPDYLGQAGAVWRAVGSLVVRADVVFQGRSFHDDANRLAEPSRRILGARVGWETATWSAWVWGRNLTDTAYRTRASENPLGGEPVGLSGEPRALGLSGETQF